MLARDEDRGDVARRLDRLARDLDTPIVGGLSVATDHDAADTD